MPHRELTDGSGHVWDVWETRPGPRSRVAPIYAEGWLTFECANPPLKRRLVPVPAGWAAFGDAKLLTMLSDAEEVTGTRRTTAVALEESSAPARPDSPPPA